MYLGIDVGGTYTDGVLINQGKVYKFCKLPTKSEDLLDSIISVLDDLLREVSSEQLTRIVLSTTLMTNLIAEGKYEPTGVVLIPGPGINFDHYKLPFPKEVLLGGVDFQGRIIEEIDEDEVIRKAKVLISKGITNLGIVSKFSPRNPKLEDQVETLIKKHFPKVRIKKGYQVSGNLNFIRRAMSTALLLACQKKFSEFISSIEKMIEQKNISCPVYILKADGGIILLDKIKGFTVDTILSGPAASAFGAKALLEEDTSAFVVDIGGTTTDLSLILNATPLNASKGVKIKEFFTHVRSLAVHSIPIGGDTGLVEDEGKIKLTFKRHGKPVCLGGKIPTITDCLRVLDLTSLGKKTEAEKSLQSIAESLGKSIESIAQEGIDLAVLEIEQGLAQILKSWKEEPAYKVWELVNPSNITPTVLISLGGPSSSLGPLLHKNKGLKHINNSLCTVANAIGAALALPIYQETIRINTDKGEISASWGYFDKDHFADKISKEDAAGLSLRLFKDYLTKQNVIEDPEIYEHEVFNMVRNWRTMGQIHEIKLEIPPRMIGRIEWEDDLND